MEPAVAFRVLGPFEVRTAGGEVLALGGLRQRALLAVLVLQAGQVLARDRLVDELWPGDPPTGAVHTLQVFVSRLRAALGPAAARLVTRTPGYMLEVGEDELDASRCERLYSQARSALAGGRPVEALAMLDEARALWRGEPLADFTYEPFAQATIARLSELRLSCREEQIEAELALGRHAALVADLEAFVREQPFRERPLRQLMLALYRSGRQADALDAFQRGRRVLVEELGVEPSASLRELEGAILKQDPSLRPATRPPAEPLASPEESAAAMPPVGGDRRIVTVLVGRLSHESAALVDPEAVGPLLADAAREAEKIIANHGGSFLTGLDGEVVGVFGIPRAHEDDALRALRAAADLRVRIPALRSGQAATRHIGIGVATGEVSVPAPGQAAVVGGPMSTSLALARVADRGEVLLSDGTHRLAEGAIRGDSAPHTNAWRLRELRPGAPSVPRRLAAPIVGRDHELDTVRAAVARVTRECTSELLTVVGEAGLGKSRIAYEITTELRDRVTVLEGRCLSYGDGIGLWPLREALTRAAAGSRAAIRDLLDGVEDADRVTSIVAAALGLTDETAAGDELPWALRKLLQALAAQRPLLLIIDDAHWAESPLLELIDYLIDWLTTAPVLVLCLARRELLDARPQWAGGRDRVSSLLLRPLGPDDAVRLLANLPGTTALDEHERARLLRAGEGNPLFIEQLLAMRLEDLTWRFDYPVPGTIRTLLAARLDRLGPGERAFIDRAAIVGREFPPSAVVDMMPPDARRSARHHVHALVRRGLLRPTGDGRTGDDELAFHHILIRDVAYHSMPKAVRSRLHEQFARWMEQRTRDEDEFIGHHLEKAYRYRRELEPPSDATGELARDAGDRLASGGRRAILRGDVRAAIQLLERAAELFDAGPQPRPDVLLELAGALMDDGRFFAAGPVLQEALEQARAARDEVLAARVSIELSTRRLFLNLDAEVEDMLAIAQRAIGVFDRAGDTPGLARAWHHVGLLHWSRSECADCERELERALAHSHRTARTRDRSHIVDLLARAIVIGPRPVDDGIVRCEALKRTADDDIVVIAVIDTMLAVLEAMRARIDVARAHYRQARECLVSLGLQYRLAGLGMWIARAELTAGDPELAESELEHAYSVLEHARERGRLPTIAAYMARVYFEQDKLEAAESLTQVAEDMTSPRDVGTQVLWRSTRARVLSRFGEDERAEDLARSSVALARETDLLPIHAEALTDLAHVLAERDRTAEAQQALDDALTLHERKQNRASAETVAAIRRKLDRVGAPRLDASHGRGYG